ncbi:MAG: substrate-binding domain-containing protein, partial [Devosia sp.]
MHKFLVSLSLATMFTAAGANGALAAGEKVSVITPYLSATATAEMIEAFKAQATQKGWTVDVVDTAGDMGAFASRVEDATTSGANAIVLVSVDPAQIQDQVDKAKAAGIAVITIDGAKNASTVLNVTSDNYVLGETMSKFLIDTIGGKGNIVRFFHSAHPGVRQREIALDDALKANPDVKEVANHYVQVPGQIEDSRAAMDAILLANPGDGAIDAVWAAWDEPGIGANLAIEAAGREGIVIAGIDGNPEAVELIKACGNYIGTVRQGFGEMANIAAEELNK